MQPQTTGATPIPFRFTGSGGEYFRIWIVNLLLSIVTLGVYSAWAKVRRNRYFYGNTRLGNASFQYLATPKTILRGRLVAAGVFGVYSVVSHLWPQGSLLLWLLFIGLLPWLIVKSLIFRTRNTAFRNIRFDFKGAYGKAAWVFVFIAVLIPLTLGLILPYMNYAQRRFVTEHSAYGATPFLFKAKVAAFYGIYGKALLMLLACIALLVAAFVALATQPELAPYATLMVLPFLLFLLFLSSYGNSRLSNLAYNHTSLGGHRFKSSLRARELFRLYLSNAVGIVMTLGFFIPWAKVRLARYQAEHLRFVPQGDLDQFFAAQSAKAGSIGEEMGEMFDVDVGI